MKQKKYYFIFFKLVLVFAIFFWIFSKIEMKDLGQRLGHVAFAPFAVAIFFFIIGRFLAAARWNILLHFHNIRAGYFNLVRIVFTSQFLGVLVPAGLGVDAARFYQIQKQEKNFTASMGSILADRMIALLGMAVISMIAVIFSWDHVHNKTALWIVLLFCAVLILMFFLLVTSLPLRVLEFFHKRAYSLFSLKVKGNTTNFQKRILKFLDKARSKSEEIHSSLGRLIKNNTRTFLQLCLLNLFVQLIRVIVFHFLFRSVGENVPFNFEVTFVPIIMLLTLLPVTFLGIGVKEGAFVYFFSQVGVPNSASLSVCLLSYVIFLGGLIPGVILFLIGKKKSSLVVQDQVDLDSTPGA